MASALGKILLITGNAEYLAARTRAEALNSVLSAHPECEVTEASAVGLGPGELAGLTSPSLFSNVSALVLSELEELSDQAQAELLTYAGQTSPDIVLVLIHGGGQKGRGLLDKLRKLDAVIEAKHEAPKSERDFVNWVTQEARRHQVRIDHQAASLLVASVGKDLRALAGAVDQLTAAIAPSSEISPAIVGQYFGGRADVKGYDIADAAIEGRIAAALEQARWADAARVAPLVVTAALSSGLRSLAKLASAPAGQRDSELAPQIGVPSFKIRHLRQQLRNWGEAELKQAIEVVAQADLAVKGGAADPAFAVERMILQVAAARRRD